MTFRLLSLVLTLILLAMPVSAQISETQTVVEDAKRDAQQDVSPFAWGFGGCAGSGFVVLYAYIVTPHVPVHQLIGKSPAYVITYTTVYKQHVKCQRVRSATIGCGIAAGMSALANMFLLPQLNLQ